MNDKMKKAEEKAKRYSANKERKKQKLIKPPMKRELEDTNIIKDVETLFFHSNVMQSQDNLLFPSFVSTNTKGFGMFRFLDTGYTTPDNIKLINELRNQKAVILAIIEKNKWIDSGSFLLMLGIKTSLNKEYLAIHQLNEIDLIVYFDNNISEKDIDLMYRLFHNSFSKKDFSIKFI